MAATSVIPTPPGYVVRPPEGHSAPSIPAKQTPYKAWQKTHEDHEATTRGSFANKKTLESLDEMAPQMAPQTSLGVTSQHSEHVCQTASRPVSLQRSGSRTMHVAKDRKSGLFGFTDKDSIKTKVRAAMLKDRNKPDYYHQEGLAQWIARHNVFDHITLVVIALNAVWIWIDTDFNAADTFFEAETHFQVVEHLFCTYFTLEILVRFAAYRRKRDGLKDGWFVFDSLLVVLMIFETWILLLVTVIRNKGPLDLGFGDASVLRLFRLLRLSRLLRMMRSLPELMILVKGMLTAMRSVLYVICLLAIITYVFAIALTQLSKGTTMHETYFNHVPLSMYSLLVHGTFLDDLSGFCNDIRSESPVCLVLVFAFVALACCTVMNMLIGVLCEVVSSTAATEKEEILTQVVSERMQSIIGTLDNDSNNFISYEEFRKIMNYPEALQALEDVGVDPVHIVDFAELWFFDEGIPVQQSFESFMEMVLDLRSSNTATVRDIKHLWLETKQKFIQNSIGMEELRAQMTGIDARTKRVEDKMDLLLGEFRKFTKASGDSTPTSLTNQTSPCSVTLVSSGDDNILQGFKPRSTLG